MEKKNLRIETKCVQGGYNPGSGEPRQIPIIQSTTFKYATSEDMGKLFDLEASGYFYSRLQNPTCDTVAARICQLEGGSAAMLTSSGQAANFFAVFNIASAGDHVVSSSAIYGGSYNLFAVTMKRMGIEFTFVSPDSTEEELEAAIRPNTKAIFGETIANPALNVLDIELFAKVAHRNGIPLIVDNTFATPINCRPFEWGADIVTHSTTKYMDGHGSAVGGCIVDSGKFDWRASGKFPGLCTPDDSYHGVTYVDKFGLEGAFITKATAQLLRDFGCTQSPQSTFILGLGLVAFIFDTFGGIMIAKIMNIFSRKKINPMIGAAGISAFPMSARVVHKLGLEEDNSNFLLMHSIGVNVSGQIASVIAGGLILSIVGKMLGIG